jgi:outer membrane lipoprotein SlyB
LKRQSYKYKKLKKGPKMKKRFYTFGTAVILLSSCESKTGQGAAIGLGVGAVSGALITGSAGGALVGGAIGAGTGAIIGAALDDDDRENMRQNSPSTLHRIDNQQQLTLDDIKQMSKNGLRDQVIMDQIRSTHSVFYLTSSEIVDLKKAGVTQNVIDFMIQTGQTN